MPGKNLDQLVVMIMNVPPFQLPPIIHASGCYSLDITYKGQNLHKVGYTIEECLDSYLNHVTKIDYMCPSKGKEPLADLPVKYGTKIDRKR
jgi:hypothetical protein